ncbi:MAG: HEAT repeat domain-containing protein [Phycisphaeraceae bacterium]|nr:hypothetical protein [Phycisphaerales bacterium]QOJ18436.1 MAG: HEAT repeat domain-containing protein [Phycisphaeraceae bacterium]
MISNSKVVDAASTLRLSAYSHRTEDRPMGGSRIVGAGRAGGLFRGLTRGMIVSGWVAGGVMLAAIAGGGLLGGCSSFTADFAALTEDLMPPTPSEAAVMMMDQYDAEKRRRGTSLIANSPFGGADPYVKFYADRLNPDHPDRETNPIVIATLIRALARHGQPPHALTIATYLTHESIQVRWEAAKGLQRLHNPAVTGAICAVVLSEAQPADVRVEAADALGQYPEDRSFQALVAALSARELMLNRIAAQSLATLTGQDFGEDARAWLRWYNNNPAPFAGKREYLYPTYQRDDTLLEKVAFWSRKTWETPQQPAGLRPSEHKSTYGDADNRSGGSGG